MAVPRTIAHHRSCRPCDISKGDEAARRAISQWWTWWQKLLSWLSLVGPLFVVEVKPYGHGCLWEQKSTPSFATIKRPGPGLETHLHAYLTKTLFGAKNMQVSLRHKTGPGLYHWAGREKEVSTKKSLGQNYQSPKKIHSYWITKGRGSEKCHPPFFFFWSEFY